MVTMIASANPGALAPSSRRSERKFWILLKAKAPKCRPNDAPNRQGWVATHPWRFGASLGLHFGAFAFSNIQNFLSLRLLLGANAPGLAEAIMVTIAVAALDQVFFFVPGG